MAQKMNRRMGGELLLKLELRSDPGMLCVVRGAMERLTEVLGFSAAECRSVTRAVDEAITNIMRHSYKNQLHKPIQLQAVRLKWTCKLLLMYANCATTIDSRVLSTIA